MAVGAPHIALADLAKEVVQDALFNMSPTVPTFVVPSR
jgi:hypothetical protein